VIVLGLTPVRDLDLDLDCGRGGVPDVAVGVSEVAKVDSDTALS
jgi:hypothetical protein